MLRVLQHAHGVHKPVAALLGHHEAQVAVVAVHGEEVAGVIGAERGLAGLHLVVQLIHEKALIHACVPCVGDQLIRLPDFGLVRGVDGVAQVHQRRADSVPWIADHAHLSGILGVKEGGPAVDLPAGHGRVVDDAQSAPGVGHSILVFRVKGQIFVLAVDFLIVGDQAEIQL